MWTEIVTLTLWDRGAPLIFGHAHPMILQAITGVMSKGTSFGASTEAEVLFAEENR